MTVSKPFAKQLKEWNDALTARAGRGLIELLREVAHDLWGEDVPPPSPVEDAAAVGEDVPPPSPVEDAAEDAAEDAETDV
jgi:hypothetical protein